MRITILGCGSSAGVPEIGCQCSVCQSTDPKNKRSRVSVLVETDGKHLLIDSSPELHQQAVRSAIPKIDAVLYTHAHSDHVAGLDDLRGFNKISGKPLPVYGNIATLQALQQRFSYAFLPMPKGWFRPCLTPQSIEDAPITAFNAAGVNVTAFTQIHGKINSLGYRIGDFAYSTDCDALPETAFAALAGVKIWVVDCLRYGKSHTHASLAQSLEWISRVKPERAVLTHMAHDFDYHALLEELPAGIVPGYDGMVVEL